MANSLLGPLRSALKFVLGDTQAKAESEALQGLGEGEAAALRVRFSRVAALRPDPTSIDPVTLAAELRIPEGLGDRLFRAIQLQAKAGHHGDVKPGATETSDEAGRAATMTLVTMARGLCEICTPSRESQIEFLLSVLGDDCGFVSRERCRELLCVMIEHALPLERAGDTDLRDRLVRMSLDLAWTFAQASSEKGLTPDEAERWLQEDTEARACLGNLLRAHFLRMPDGHGQVDEEKRKLPRLRRRSLLLSDELLWLLSPCLSEQCLARPWKRLFCSVRHGQSFARLVSRVVFKGPTLLAIKDTGGHVFGVFAPVSWHKDNKFFGTSQTMVFSAAPKVRVYRASGYNDHYLWLSSNLASCTNGLGVGGQCDYWGIFLDSALEKGACRAPCSTFERSMPCLASAAEFDVAHVEVVWGCIPGYEADEKELEAAGVKRKHARTFEEFERQCAAGAPAGSKKASALDGNVEAKAIMHAAGIGGHSDDIRQADAVLDKERRARRVAQGLPADDSEASSSDGEFLGP